MDDITKWWGKYGSLEKGLIIWGIILGVPLLFLDKAFNSEVLLFAWLVCLAPPIMLLTKRPVEYLVGVIFDAVSPEKKPAPSPEEDDDYVTKDLWRVVIDEQLSVPPHMDAVIAVGDAILDDQRFSPDNPNVDNVELRDEMRAALKAGYAAVIKSLASYLRVLPKFNPAPLTQPLHKAIDFPRLAFSLIEPFRDERLKKFGMAQFVLDNFNEAVRKQTGRQQSRELVFPQTYEGNNPVEAYFGTSPFKPILDIEVPYPLWDTTRFEHHHIIGPRGKGKTTFLSHLINYDINRDVSVVVIDSQYRLIDGFARLEKKPLLISPKFPIPMNPFKWGNTDDVVEILTYAFGSIFETDLTQLQAGPLEYIIRAVAQDPDANLDTLVDFIVKPKQSLVAKTDPNTQKYFANFFKDLPNQSRSGIVQKLMAFRRHAAIDAMLNAKTNELNLPDLLQQGCVVLIDTNKDELTSDQCHVFGKLFIALLHNTMRKRTKLPEDTLKPVFTFIDELADYCPPDSDDKKFRELLDQSRKQKMGFIVAHQREDQINPRVLASLRDCAIKTVCLQPGLVENSIYGQATRLQIPPFAFPSRITDEQYAARYTRELSKNTSTDDLPDELTTREF